MLTDLRILVVDTAPVWWRLLPQVLGLYLLGWLGSEAALRLAVVAGEVSAWLALVLFSFSFVSLLTALVLILQVVGRELGIRALIPAEEAAVDGRDESVGQLLAVTLLPFLAARTGWPRRRCATAGPGRRAASCPGTPGRTRRS